MVKAWMFGWRVLKREVRWSREVCIPPG